MNGRPPGTRQSEGTSLLALTAASKRYGDIVALEEASFTVEPGRMLGFLGPNGAGKTTAMRAVFGLVRLDAGHAAWNDRPIQLEDLLRFGYMPEERGLYPKMKVGDQIRYLARLHGLNAADAREATERWLDELGISDRIDSKLEVLSHGNQQRVQLAAALVHGPDVLVLDEPFSGLDPIGVETMEDVIRRRAGEGVAVVFSSRQLDLVEGLVDDVAIINQGRIVLHGDIDDVRNRAAHRRLDISLGGSAADWTPDLPGVTEIEREDKVIRMSVSLDVELADVLSSVAAAGGRIERLNYEPPNLSEIFREAVQA